MVLNHRLLGRIANLWKEEKDNKNNVEKASSRDTAFSAFGPRAL
jgi:hypothetical protein